jgi:hypothetical protein
MHSHIPKTGTRPTHLRHGVCAALIVITGFGVFIVWRGLPALLEQAKSTAEAAKAVKNSADASFDGMRYGLHISLPKSKTVPQSQTMALAVYLRDLSSGEGS